MPLKRMNNVLIVVDDLEAVKTFFIELGLKLEGEQTIMSVKLVGPLRVDWCLQHCCYSTA